MRSEPARVVRVLTATLAASSVMAAAGCGGGSGAPGVAALGSTGATTSSTTTAHTASAGYDSSTLAACFRSHGFPATEDSSGGGGSNGELSIHLPGLSISGDPKSTQFQAAMQACRKDLPGGGPPALTPAQQAESRRELTVFAACMRKHGVPGFPNPSSQGTFPIGSLQAAGLMSSQSQAAARTCQPLLGKIGARLTLPGMT
jgi:hypothetical protein